MAARATKAELPPTLGMPDEEVIWRGSTVPFLTWRPRDDLLAYLYSPSIRSTDVGPFVIGVVRWRRATDRGAMIGQNTKLYRKDNIDCLVMAIALIHDFASNVTPGGN
jgi:hypothetical protein